MHKILYTFLFLSFTSFAAGQGAVVAGTQRPVWAVSVAGTGLDASLSQVGPAFAYGELDKLKAYLLENKALRQVFADMIHSNSSFQEFLLGNKELHQVFEDLIRGESGFYTFKGEIDTRIMELSIPVGRKMFDDGQTTPQEIMEFFASSDSSFSLDGLTDYIIFTSWAVLFNLAIEHREVESPLPIESNASSNRPVIPVDFNALKKYLLENRDLRQFLIQVARNHKGRFVRDMTVHGLNNMMGISNEAFLEFYRAVLGQMHTDEQITADERSKMIAMRSPSAPTPLRIIDRIPLEFSILLVPVVIMVLLNYWYGIPNPWDYCYSNYCSPNG